MRILIADDHQLLRRGIIRILETCADVEECIEATNGKEAIEKALKLKPDLIVLDIRLPIVSGFDAARNIKQHEPDIPILFFSMDNASETVEEARLLGDGFVSKNKIVEMLPNAVNALRHKQTFFPSE